MPEGEPQTTRIAVLGLHDTGKSNFVGALFLALDAPDVETMLSLAGYTGNRKHVNKLADAIRRGKDIGRTKTAEEGEFESELRDGDGNVFELHVRDWSGEALERALEKRRMRSDLTDEFAVCDGVLLFVHPDALFELKEIETIDQWLAGVKEAGGEVLAADLDDDQPGSDEDSGEKASPDDPDGPGDDEGPPATKKVRWNNRLASTDLKMVDALQEVIKMARPGLRVAVVISAWDIAAKDVTTPASWLEKRFPLLDEFLQSNQDSLIQSTVFGISARGRPEAEMDEEFLATKAAKRIKVVGEGAREHDMTAPIAWLRG